MKITSLTVYNRTFLNHLILTAYFNPLTLLAGPWDIDMAKELRPESIRAKFGFDKVRSAVHCTDLPADGVTECEYCFNLLTN